MNLCWIGAKAEGGHVREVDTAERAARLDAGYIEFRLTCFAPDSTREGTLYDQVVRAPRSWRSMSRRPGWRFSADALRLRRVVERATLACACRRPIRRRRSRNICPIARAEAHPGHGAARTQVHLPQSAHA